MTDDAAAGVAGPSDEPADEPTVEPAAEPTGHTVDGTPWEEARGPHLPDPVTGATRRVPLVAWVFVGLAVASLAWELRGFVGQLGSMDAVDIVSLLVNKVPPVATILFGAALFIRHRDARTTDPMLVFGIVLLTLTEGLGVVASLVGERFETLTPIPEGTFYALAPSRIAADVIVRLVGIFGVLYVARGLVDAREREDAPGGPLRRLVVFLVAGIVLVSIGTQVLSFLGTNRDAMGSMDAAYLFLALALYVGSVLAALYLAATAWRGATAGERPRRAWRLAALGAWAIVIGSVVSTVAFATLAFLVDTERFGDIVAAVFYLVGVVTALGYLLVLAAFFAGLPGVDQVASDVDDADDVEAEAAEAAEEAEVGADPEPAAQL